MLIHFVTTQTSPFYAEVKLVAGVWCLANGQPVPAASVEVYNTEEEGEE